MKTIVNSVEGILKLAMFLSGLSIILYGIELLTTDKEIEFKLLAPILIQIVVLSSLIGVYVNNKKPK